MGWICRAVIYGTHARSGCKKMSQVMVAAELHTYLNVTGRFPLLNPNLKSLVRSFCLLKGNIVSLTNHILNSMCNERWHGNGTYMHVHWCITNNCFSILSYSSINIPVWDRFFTWSTICSIWKIYSFTKGKCSPICLEYKTFDVPRIADQLNCRTKKCKWHSLTADNI